MALPELEILDGIYTKHLALVRLCVQINGAFEDSVHIFFSKNITEIC